MPIFNTNNQIGLDRFNHWVKSVIEKKKRVKCEDLKLKTLSQNAYLHLCLEWFALNSGYRTEWVKLEIFKKMVNPSLFLVDEVNEKNGEVYITVRSWSDFTKEEAITAINRFIDYSIMECDIRMPDPKDLPSIGYIKEELERNSQYL